YGKCFGSVHRRPELVGLQTGTQDFQAAILRHFLELYSVSRLLGDRDGPTMERRNEERKQAQIQESYVGLPRPSLSVQNRYQTALKGPPTPAVRTRPS